MLTIYHTTCLYYTPAFTRNKSVMSERDFKKWMPTPWVPRTVGNKNWWIQRLWQTTIILLLLFRTSVQKMFGCKDYISIIIICSVWRLLYKKYEKTFIRGTAECCKIGIFIDWYMKGRTWVVDGLGLEEVGVGREI